jgi:serine/threonine-protein kinase
MSIAAGKRLGPYEIIALLGAGGMGEVYRARDPRLNREVAVKVLPASFANDPERLRRFEQEAHATSALNHPNILAIYDVGTNEGAPYVVSELLDGESLRERLERGPLTPRKTIHYAIQIANGLSAAHERNIIHRDLKPDNLFLTGDERVKILDFGLAKLIERFDPNVPQTDLETRRVHTEPGTVIGTVGYMSPEQVRGAHIDHRSDIFSFGAVLYEMLAGQRPFRRETTAETMTAILREDPPQLGTAERPLPPTLDRIVRRCLEKEPARRFQSALDLAFALNEVDSTTQPSGVAPARMSRVPWLVAAAFAVIAAIALWAPDRATRPAPRPLMRLSVDLGPDAIPDPMVTAAISPDGTRLVFPFRGPDGKRLLATRLLDQPKVVPLAGTEDGEQPFFSPDGQSIGFFANNKLKRVSILGGTPVALCDVNIPRGASWGDDGSIVLANGGAGLSRVPAEGGQPQALTKLDEGELTHRWPQVLPGSKAVLFTAHAPTINSYEDASIDVQSLETGKRKTLWRGGYFGRYLPSGGSRGHLVYIHQGVLFGVPFDPARLEIEGTPAPLVEDVASDPGFAAGQFDISHTGIFVYRSGRGIQSWSVVWLDSSGSTRPLLAKQALYYSPRFSPDGKRLAIGVDDGKGADIFIYDWQQDTMSRLTFTAQMNSDPVWTPDGNHILFRTRSAIWWTRADGAGEAQHLLNSSVGDIGANSFSPDGRLLVFAAQDPATQSDLWMLPLDISEPDHPKPGKPEPFLQTPFNETRPALSPDGRWISYTSNESGANEVYVRPFPPAQAGGKWQISTGGTGAGAGSSIWSRNGREMFYVGPGSRIMVVDYMTRGNTFVASKPRPWSPARLLGVGFTNLDLAPDGKHFAVFPMPETATEEKTTVHVTFLLNFFDEVRRRLPAGK